MRGVSMMGTAAVAATAELIVRNGRRRYVSYSWSWTNFPWNRRRRHVWVIPVQKRGRKKGQTSKTARRRCHPCRQMCHVVCWWAHRSGKLLTSLCPGGVEVKIMPLINYVNIFSRFCVYQFGERNGTPRERAHSKINYRPTGDTVYYYIADEIWEANQLRIICAPYSVCWVWLFENKG